MTKEKEHWDNVMMRVNPLDPHYDGWLDKYFDKLPDTELHIVELGCGWGDDTSFLSKTRYNIISCDFSDESINMIKNLYPTVKTMQFNLLDGLPFPTGSVQVVVADLCLHYFTTADIDMIIAEIYRVLSDKGQLICRVNSTNDLNYGAGEGTEIEPNLYSTDTGLRRFFDDKSISVFFKHWHIQYLSEYTLGKYPKPKVVWEAALSKH